MHSTGVQYTTMHQRKTIEDPRLYTTQFLAICSSAQSNILNVELITQVSQES